MTVVESALREEEIEFGEIDRKTGSGIDLLKTLAVCTLSLFRWWVWGVRSLLALWLIFVRSRCFGFDRLR